MRVCLLTSEARHSDRGEHIAALAGEMGDAVVVATGTEGWTGAVRIDELATRFDAAIAFGWQACLHVFRVQAGVYGYVLPALEEAQLWHGDERRLLAALTYDLPLTLVAPSRAVARALEERGPGRRVVVVEPGVPRGTMHAPAPQAGALRIAGAPPEVLERMSEAAEQARDGDVCVELNGPDQPLTHAPRAMLAGIVPVVTPVEGHDELVTDGEDGLVAGFDDVPGTARALDTLARDRDLLRRLSQAAVSRAERLPTIAQEAAGLLDALSGAEPDSAWPSRLLLNARAAAEPIAQERRALDVALNEYEGRIEALTAENDRLKADLEEARRSLLERLRARTR